MKNPLLLGGLIEPQWNTTAGAGDLLLRLLERRGGEMMKETLVVIEGDTVIEEYEVERIRVVSQVGSKDYVVEVWIPEQGWVSLDKALGRSKE